MEKVKLKEILEEEEQVFLESIILRMENLLD